MNYMFAVTVGVDWWAQIKGGALPVTDFQMSRLDEWSEYSH